MEKLIHVIQIFLAKVCQKRNTFRENKKMHACITQIRADMTENQSTYLITLKCYYVCWLHTLSRLHTQLLGFSHTGFCFT